MYSQTLFKPDGRKITLYSRYPIEEGMIAPSPGDEPIQANPHLRWHPLRGEWVAYTSYSQQRTLMPPEEYNPLAPTKDLELPPELPRGQYDVAVFDRGFPSLTLNAHHPPESIVETLPANGACEMVVFTQDSRASLGGLELSHLELILQVWADRIDLLGKIPQIQYVLPFENKGAEMGVSVLHPHGQIYAYPFLPPVPSRMFYCQRMYYMHYHRGLLPDLITEEIQDRQRVIYLDEEVVAFVPACARYPYEVWVAPIQQVASFNHLTERQRQGLAKALKTVLLKYDGLWNRPFPYLMAWYPAPTDGNAHPEWHLHAQFYLPYQNEKCLKYWGGRDLAGGMFVNDSLPEETAKELQAVMVNF